jgi:hypothetical protein
MNMIKRLFLFVTVIMALLITGCIKNTYDMSKLDKDAQLTPTLAISAAKGDVSLSDIVKTNDTVVFDKNNLVILVFKRDNIINLSMSDFSKGTLDTKTATIEPTSYNIGIDDILNHIKGDIKFFSPSIILNYTNSFTDSLKVTLNVTGKRDSKTVDLALDPFTLTVPNTSVDQEVTDSYIIDKTNSNIADLVSLPPEDLEFSGTAVLYSYAKGNQTGENILSSGKLNGSVEVDVPLDMEFNNLQFADTVDNFLKDDNNNGTVKAENIKLLRVILTATNGFPLGASVKMSLYDSSSKTIKSTIEATDILNAAPVGSDGKATGTTETSTNIEFTTSFFDQVNNADQIIFGFTLNTTDSGTKEVKIYSDYRIKFTAAVVAEPEIDLNDN